MVHSMMGHWHLPVHFPLIDIELCHQSLSKKARSASKSRSSSFASGCPSYKSKKGCAGSPSGAGAEAGGGPDGGGVGVGFDGGGLGGGGLGACGGGGGFSAAAFSAAAFSAAAFGAAASYDGIAVLLYPRPDKEKPQQALT